MDYYRDIIGKLLHSLTAEKKIIFALLTSEKLMPNYTYFSQKQKWGNPLILEEIIKIIIEKTLSKEKITLPEMTEYVANIEAITPDTNDFDGISVSFALDACTALISTLNFMKDQSLNDIVDVALYARDTVDMYVQVKEDIDPGSDLIERIIEKDSFMRIEKERQSALIRRLKELPVLSAENLENLRQLENKPIIDIDLIPFSRR